MYLHVNGTTCGRGSITASYIIISLHD